MIVSPKWEKNASSVLQEWLKQLYQENAHQISMQVFPQTANISAKQSLQTNPPVPVSVFTVCVVWDGKPFPV